MVVQHDFWHLERTSTSGSPTVTLQVLTISPIAVTALPGNDPLYLGHEVVGEVSEVGSGVSALQVGDRVIMDSRATLSPTCLSQVLGELCRHYRAGRYPLCENASLGRIPTASSYHRAPPRMCYYHDHCSTKKWFGAGVSQIPGTGRSSGGAGGESHEVS